MFIFNLGGFLVAASTFAAFWGLETYLQITGSLRFADLIFMSIFFIVGLIVELVGLKPRIFFIPCWFLGIIGLSMQAYKLWGWPALMVGLLLIGIGIKLLFVLINKGAEKSWIKVQSNLNHYQHDDKTSDIGERKKKLYQCFFSSVQLDNTTEILNHNMVVIKKFIEDFPQSFSEDEVATLESFVGKTREMIILQNLKWNDMSIVSELDKLLLAKLDK